MKMPNTKQLEELNTELENLYRKLKEEKRKQIDNQKTFGPVVFGVGIMIGVAIFGLTAVLIAAGVPGALAGLGVGLFTGGVLIFSDITLKRLSGASNDRVSKLQENIENLQRKQAELATEQASEPELENLHRKLEEEKRKQIENERTSGVVGFGVGLVAGLVILSLVIGILFASTPAAVAGTILGLFTAGIAGFSAIITNRLSGASNNRISELKKEIEKFQHKKESPEQVSPEQVSPKQESPLNFSKSEVESDSSQSFKKQL